MVDDLSDPELAIKQDVEEPYQGFLVLLIAEDVFESEVGLNVYERGGDLCHGEVVLWL